MNDKILKEAKLLLMILVVLVASLFFLKKRQTEDMTNCFESSFQLNLRIKSNFFLLGNRKISDSELKGLILIQMKYIPFQIPRVDQNVVWASMPLENIEIHSYELKNAKYPLRYDIHPKYENTRDLSLEEMAKKVSFEADFQLNTCLKDEKKLPKLSDLKVLMPKDPINHFFVVGKEVFREKYSKILNKATVTNPCSTEGLVDFESPAHFWYFWDPKRLEKDLDCSKVYKNGTHYEVVDLKVLQKRKRSFELMNKGIRGRKTLNISILYDLSDLDLRLVNKAVLTEHLELAFTEYDIHKFRETIQFYIERYEDGVEIYKGLIYLRNISKTLGKVKVVDIRADDGSIKLTLKSENDNRTQARRLNILFANSSYFKLMDFQSVMIRHFQGSDVSIYEGHSELGERLDFELRSSLGKNKIIALHSCYSDTYFRGRKKLLNRSGIDLILVGSDYKDFVGENSVRLLKSVLNEKEYDTTQYQTEISNHLIIESF